MADIFDELVAKRYIEGLLFLSSTPLTIKDISKMTGFKPAVVSFCIKELMEDYESRGINIQAVAGEYRMVTSPAISDCMQKYSSYTRSVNLSRPALETLSIVAYRQPISRGDIEKIRGVNSDNLVSKLLDMKLIRIRGRSSAPGRPLLFGTTRDFLRIFGLNSLTDLPHPDQNLDIPGESESGILPEEVCEDLSCPVDDIA